MNATPVAVAIWPVLLPVIIGGTLAILGGALSPLLSHWLNLRRTRAERRSQLFESMLGAIYEHDHWLEMRSRKLTFGESIDPGPSPIRKAQAAALIHFPELVQPLRLLSLKSSEYQQWMVKAYAARLDGKYAEMNEGFTEAYNGWMTEMSSFLDISAKYASDRSGAV